MSVDDPGLVVTRWRRYGKDRIYVATADGEQLGFWDLVADRGRPTTPAHEPALLTAVAAWKAGQVETGEAVALMTARTDAPEEAADSEPPPTWLDLAGNQAGAEMRKQALAAREAAPVKTVLARILGVTQRLPDRGGGKPPA
jgi:hypothetical protein